ncbi:MAG TPA: RecX family transcriptional regulator [Patescibacteria group bacterium]|nr:RecX family transcriptional regulator [Patescibacteria group bacterium]
MNKQDSPALQKAKRYAFLLLKFRMRSEAEISRRLEAKKFDRQTIAQVVSFLKEKGFLDDDEFARAWIASRIKKPLGLRRLRVELRLKGIDSDIIDRQIGRVKEEYSEEAIVERLVREKSGKLKGLDPQQAKRRIFSSLVRRGFSSDAIVEAISKLDS